MGHSNFRRSGFSTDVRNNRLLRQRNHLLVGDAAGMVLPSNGAGITIAMVGGRIAGQQIVFTSRKWNTLDEYEKEWKRQMGSVMRN